MRFIKTEDLREGMIVGRSLRGRRGEVMLVRGVPLRDVFIESIRRLQYSGVYVRDDFSEEIEADEIVEEDLMTNAILAVKRLEEGMRLGTDGSGKFFMEVEKYIEEITNSVLDNRDVVFNLADLKIYDDCTYQHSVNVCVLSQVIGAAMWLPRDQMICLGMASVLHDVGKFFVEKTILNKTGWLTNEEFEHIKKHSLLGCEYLRANYQFPASVHMGVLQHHERYDGSGYPLERQGNDIHQLARIIAISDVYDAITSLRPYRKPVLPSEAYEYILGNAGQHFDPEITNVFVRKVAPFPLGMTVELSNGMKGVVVENYTDFMTRPKIKLLPGFGSGEEYVMLKDDPAMLNVTITKLI